MNILTSLVLFGFQQNALAGTPYYNPIPVLDNFKEWKHSDKMGTVGSVSLDGETVDLPLYHVDVSPLLYTYGGSSAEKQEEIIALMPETSLIVVTESFAKDNELEIQTTNKRLIPVPDDFKTGGEIKYVEISELHVGKLVLKDIIAFVSGSETSGFDSTGSLNYSEMAIGLAALPVSYAVLESEGLVRVTSEENGPKLLADIGTGIIVPYQEMPWLIGTVGEKSLSGKAQTILPSLSLIIPASFGAEETVSTLVNFSSSKSFLDKYYAVESDIFGYSYDLRLDWLTPNIGTDLATTYATRPTLMDADDPKIPMAGLGANILSQYDIVVDKSSNTIGFKKASAQKRTASFSIELEKTKAELETAKADEEAEEGSIPVAEINALISILKNGQHQKYAETIEYYDLLLANAEEKTDCALWMGYGSVQQKLGNLDKAKEAYQESATLYHSWWNIDLRSRMDINKAQDGMKDEEIDAAKELSKDAALNSVDGGWYISQPDSCHIADGLVASIDLAQGKNDAVEKNYHENLDLDAGLARTFGNSSLIQGNTELAHEVYRQAVGLENGRTERSLNRLGLALIYADQGKWTQSDELFQEVMVSSKDSLIPQLWADNLRANVGAEKTLETLHAWNDAHPLDGEGKIALLREYQIQIFLAQEELDLIPITEELQEEVDSPELTAQKELLSGLENDAKKAQEDMKGYFADVSRLYRFHPNQRATLEIDYALFSGDTAKAETLLADALKTSTAKGLFLSQANLYAQNGQVDKAEEALKKAASLAPSHAGYSLFLK